MKSGSVPTVSVVMGVYNAERTVRAAVDSILSQSFGDFEFIIVDDGSTDSTGRILAEYAGSDDRVRVIKQANQGLTRSLITGTSQARGHFLARQDADDVSLPDRLARQIALLSADEQAVLATSWVEDFSREGVSCGLHKTLKHCVPLSSGQPHDLVGIAAHGTVLMRRSSLERAGGYRACFYYAQDSDLWLRLSELGKFLVVPEVLYRRLVGTESISSRFRSAQMRYSELAIECFRAVKDGRSEAAFLDEAEKLADDCRNAKGRTTARFEQATSMLLIAAQLRQRDPSLANKYLWAGLKTCPWHLRLWKALFMHRGRRLGKTIAANGELVEHRSL